MEHLGFNDAYKLVLTALGSKAITLGGTVAHSDPKAAGEQDAQYVMALLNGLQKPDQP